MALKRKGGYLPIVIAVAALGLVFDIPLTWAQLSEASSESDEGPWCSDEGCARWWTLFTVRLIRDQISIQYRDTSFRVFSGSIKERTTKWTITGTLRGTGRDNKFEATVSRVGNVELEGIITGYFNKAEQGGKKQEESTVTFQGVSEKTVVRKATQAGIEGRIEGTLKATIKTVGKEEAIEGPFEGLLRKKEDVTLIRGVYTPPPERCSEPGRYRSRDEALRKEDRRADAAARAGFFSGSSEPRPTEGKAGGSARRVEGPVAEATISWSQVRSDEDRAQKNARVNYRLGTDPKNEKNLEPDLSARFRTAEEKRAQTDRLGGGSKGRLTAELSTSKPGQPGALQRTHGKFARIVDGTISAEKDKITLDLPRLPVLDHKCSVREEQPARALVLMRQNEPRK